MSTESFDFGAKLLPRHILIDLQEIMGVDRIVTAKVKMLEFVTGCC